MNINFRQFLQVYVSIFYVLYISSRLRASIDIKGVNSNSFPETEYCSHFSAPGESPSLCICDLTLFTSENYLLQCKQDTEGN